MHSIQHIPQHKYFFHLLVHLYSKRVQSIHHFSLLKLIAKEFESICIFDNYWALIVQSSRIFTLEWRKSNRESYPEATLKKENTLDIQ